MSVGFITLLPAQADPFASTPSAPFAPMNSMNATMMSKSKLPSFDAYKANLMDFEVFEISAEELYTALQGDKNIALIDVRNLHEYTPSHMQGTKRVSYMDFSAEQVLGLDKNKRIIVYSALNKRGLVVAQYLQIMGFTDVQLLDGGLISWKNESFDIYNAAGKTDKIHVGGKGNLRFLTRGRAIF